MNNAHDWAWVQGHRHFAGRWLYHVWDSMLRVTPNKDNAEDDFLPEGLDCRRLFWASEEDNTSWDQQSYSVDKIWR